MKEHIEAARVARTISNEQARLMEVVLTLSPDDAMLANRLVSQGSDPASIEYFATGHITNPIREAHAKGPGALVGNDRQWWCYLASISADEARSASLRERVAQFVEASFNFTNDTLRDMKRRAEEKEKEIRDLPCSFLTLKLSPNGERTVRLYFSDLGFAAAYWGGHPVAAVQGTHNGEAYIAVGSASTPLVDLGIVPKKLLSPTFGIL